jgi:HB1, ASXL, restriction endonuclease HTH domain
MTYYQAALEVLRSAECPLTTREVLDRALESGLIRPQGKTPRATMDAVLYQRLGKDPELIKIEDRGQVRAIRGTVRWTVRRS